jgi:hypothetical protein
LHFAPPAPLEASAARPPAASARRHRFALIRDTRNRFAISRSLAPASIISAAASRTRSGRARSAALRPPHRIPHASGIAHQGSACPGEEMTPSRSRSPREGRAAPQEGRRFTETATTNYAPLTRTVAALAARILLLAKLSNPM